MLNETVAQSKTHLAVNRDTLTSKRIVQSWYKKAIAILSAGFAIQSAALWAFPGYPPTSFPLAAIIAVLAATEVPRISWAIVVGVLSSIVATLVFEVVTFENHNWSYYMFIITKAFLSGGAATCAAIFIRHHNLASVSTDAATVSKLCFALGGYVVVITLLNSETSQWTGQTIVWSVGTYLSCATLTAPILLGFSPQSITPQHGASVKIGPVLIIAALLMLPTHYAMAGDHRLSGVPLALAITLVAIWAAWEYGLTGASIVVVPLSAGICALAHIVLEDMGTLPENNTPVWLLAGISTASLAVTGVWTTAILANTSLGALAAAETSSQRAAELNAIFRGITMSSPGATAVYTNNGTCIYAQPPKTCLSSYVPHTIREDQPDYIEGWRQRYGGKHLASMVISSLRTRISTSATIQIPSLTNGGPSRTYRAEVFPIEGLDGVPMAGVILLDVSSEASARAATERDRRMLAAILNAIEEAVVSTDSNGNIIEHNRAAAYLIDDKKNPEASSRLHRLLMRADAKHAGTLTIPCEIGAPGAPSEMREYQYVCHPSPGSGWVWVFRDVTKQIAIDAELREADKTIVMHEFAQGVAHDLRNIMSIILANAEMAVASCANQMQCAPKERLHLHINALSEAAHRGVELATQIMSIAEPATKTAVQSLQPPIAIAKAIEEATRLAASYSRPGEPRPMVAVSIHSNLPSVRCATDEISRIVQNLALNAIQAMGDAHQANPCLTVTADPEEAVEPLARPETEDMPAGLRLRITVSDNGPGIPESIKAKIFNRGFTTKKEGHGIGLSTCRNIARKNGGELMLAPQGSGQGATFILLLPAVTADTEQAAADDGSQQAQDPNEPIQTMRNAQIQRDSLVTPAEQSESNRVLVVDDEISVAMIVCRYLSLEGYATIMATSIGEAIGLLRPHLPPNANIPASLDVNDVAPLPTPPIAIVCDLNFNDGFSGADIVRAVRGTRMQQSLVLMSGEDISASSAIKLGFHAILRKPIERDELVAALKNLKTPVPSPPNA